MHGVPAPIDAAELAPALAEFGSGRMLPRTAYVDPAVLDWERANFFGRWMCVSRAEDLAAAGGRRAVDTGQGGILLVRGDDGELRAFANTCRHRGHELLPCDATATGDAIICPYHGWTYRLDGTLRGAPGYRGVEGFDPAQFGLAPIRVVEWHGWVFADPAGDSGSFGAHIGSIEPIVAPYAPERLRAVVRHDYVVEANWKIVIENYQECYHCSVIHPELCKVSPPSSGDNFDPDGAWLGGSMTLRDGVETMSLDGRSNGVPIAGLSGRELRTVMYLVGFPNLLVSLHPDYVMTHLLTPLAVDRTRIECVWAFPSEMAGDPSYAVDFWDLTNRQDWAACESVQRGLRSPHAVPGPLAPAEDGVYQFVTRVAVAYLGGGVPK
jgi:Rieske 2Fe-2S family protein